MLSFIYFFLGFFIFFFSSLHSLIIIILVEFFVLLILFFILGSFLSWYTFLVFLLVAVCVGSLGVSLIVSFSRGKGFNYTLSF